MYLFLHLCLLRASFQFLLLISNKGELPWGIFAFPRYN